MLTPDQYNTICDDVVSLLDICAKGNAIAARRLNERILQIGVDRKAALGQRDALLARLKASNRVLLLLSQAGGLGKEDRTLVDETIAANDAVIRKAEGR